MNFNVLPPQIRVREDAICLIYELELVFQLRINIGMKLFCFGMVSRFYLLLRGAGAHSKNLKVVDLCIEPRKDKNVGSCGEQDIASIPAQPIN